MTATTRSARSNSTCAAFNVACDDQYKVLKYRPHTSCAIGYPPRNWSASAGLYDLIRSASSRPQATNVYTCILVQVVLGPKMTRKTSAFHLER